MPVSKMFLLVAPQCTYPAADFDSFLRSASTSGTTGFHVRSKSLFSPSRSSSSIRAFFRISRAAEPGMSPSSASTSARATSTSSHRWSVVRSFQIARIAAVPKRSWK